MMPTVLAILWLVAGDIIHVNYVNIYPNAELCYNSMRVMEEMLAQNPDLELSDDRLMYCEPFNPNLHDELTTQEQILGRSPLRDMWR